MDCGYRLRLCFALLGTVYLRQQHRIFQGKTKKVVAFGVAWAWHDSKRRALLYGRKIFGRIYLVGLIRRRRRGIDRAMGGKKRL